MTDIKEIIPEAADLLEKISKNEPWNPVYRRPLEELLRNSALRAALREVLDQSDDMLKNIGMSDLTNEQAIKNCLRTQGVATGLSQAVETIITLATQPEHETKETDNATRE